LPAGLSASAGGTQVAVLVSPADYDRPHGATQDLVQFFRKSPLADAIAKGELDLNYW
jgi:hypothetical protein